MVHLHAPPLAVVGGGIVAVVGHRLRHDGRIPDRTLCNRCSSTPIAPAWCKTAAMARPPASSNRCTSVSADLVGTHFLRKWGDGGGGARMGRGGFNKLKRNQSRGRGVAGGWQRAASKDPVLLTLVSYKRLAVSFCKDASCRLLLSLWRPMLHLRLLLLLPFSKPLRQCSKTTVARARRRICRCGCKSFGNTFQAYLN